MKIKKVLIQNIILSINGFEIPNQLFLTIDKNTTFEIEISKLEESEKEHPQWMLLGYKTDLEKLKHTLSDQEFPIDDEIFDLDYDIIESEFRLEAAVQMNLDNLIHKDFDVDQAKEKIERNFDFLMNDYMESIETRAEQQLGKIILQP